MSALSMFSKPYKRYVIAVLTLVYALNVVDRGLIIILLQPIKEDLQLSDTQLGFLTGIAFGLFYVTLGLVIARWADRGNRATITSLALGLFGCTLMVSIWVTNFVQLLAARIAAAVGESGISPATYSLVGDYFPEPTERTRAMATYWLASPIGFLLSFILGGWLNELFGWRMTFLIMAIPALLAAILVKLTIRDPRPQVSSALGDARPAPRMKEVIALLWNQRSSRHLTLAIIMLFTMGFGLGPWYAAFMMRSHGMGTVELGVWLGLIFGLGGIVGTWLGGYVSSRWFADDERSQMRLSALIIGALPICLISFLLLPQKNQALLALVPLIALYNFFFGPTFALLQRLGTDESRATTMAFVMLLANVIGMGVGPQVVGILSDVLAPTFGTESLRYAMLITSFFAVWAAYHFWQVGKTVRADLAGIAELRQVRRETTDVSASAVAVSEGN